MDDSHALKIEDFPKLNINEANKIAEKLKEFCKEFATSDIYELSCRRCDGFIPHSWNKGGYQSHAYTDLSMVMGSGVSTGSDSFNELLNNSYDQALKDCFDDYKRENNLSKDLTYENMTESQQEDYYNFEDDWMRGDGNYTICVESQARYLGVENGIHTISLNIFLCYTDAPYHRNSDADIEIKINFRDVNSFNFKKKFNDAVKKCHDFVGNLELY